MNAVKRGVHMRPSLEYIRHCKCLHVSYVALVHSYFSYSNLLEYCHLYMFVWFPFLPVTGKHCGHTRVHYCITSVQHVYTCMQYTCVAGGCQQFSDYTKDPCKYSTYSQCYCKCERALQLLVGWQPNYTIQIVSSTCS